MRGPSAKFSRQMEAAVTALLAQRNTEEAAKVLGVGVATLLRWKKRPEFQAAFLRARRDAYSHSIARLQHASGAATSTVLRIMLDANTSPATKVRAVELVLSYAAKGIELEDILERLEALERLLAGDSKPNGEE